MTREEKQKAIDALKISAPVMCVTREEFNDYIQTLNKIMYLLEQEPLDDTEIKKIDEWEIKGKNAELWIVKENLQVRYLGTIHNIPLPSVTLQLRWISCSEKSPDKNERIALLYDNGLVSGGKYLGNKTYDVDFPDQNKRTRIVAWTPIQSYKAESEEN